MARPERETRRILTDLAPRLSSRDYGTSLEEDASDILKTLDHYPQRTDRSMLSRMEQSLGLWRHNEMAEYLSRTPDQIGRYVKKGLPWQSREKMMPRIEALFAITVALDEYYVDNYRAKRNVLTQPDEVNIGGLSIVDLISIGETEIPLALTHRALTQQREVDEYQKTRIADPI